MRRRCRRRSARWRRWIGRDDRVSERGSRLLATGHADMRKGFGSLALLVQEALKRDMRMRAIFMFSGGAQET